MADDRWATSNSAYGSFWKAVPLEPRVNAHVPHAEAAPSAERFREEEASRVRLSRLLRNFGAKEREVKGDGNCQFRALADQLYGSEDHHEAVRELAVKQLENSESRYSGFVPGKFRDYLASMSRSGTWGDHVTLQAVADALGIRINVLTDYITDGFIEVTPQRQRTDKVLKITFWREVHYNSVVE